MLRPFLSSFILSAVALLLAFFWAGWEAVLICGLLTLMEVSFSFDNAVVNAVVLKGMSDLWRKRFLTWGMIIAVFGMRLLFPILIVAFAAGLPMPDVVRLAVENPGEYSAHVLAAHVQIGAFGGMFLLMVFLQFMFNEQRTLHWIAVIEHKLGKMGKLESVEVVVALLVLLVTQQFLAEDERLHAMISGTTGIILYVLVHSITALMGGGHGAAQGMARSGMMGFIYLQFLDASFSLDGVIGAFAISKDIVIIMLGLGAGAMFVRSLTVLLVRKGTLDKYVFLEHGAHYGIGALAVIMLVGMVRPVPEIITGLIGIGFILLALASSVKYNRKRA